MAKLFVQHGNTMTFIAPAGGVVNGKLYIQGAIPHVADITAAEGQSYEGHIVGVWGFTNKTAADTPAQWAKAYLKADGTEITSTATGNKLIGVFAEAGVDGSTDCVIRLNGVAV